MEAFIVGRCTAGLGTWLPLRHLHPTWGKSVHFVKTHNLLSAWVTTGLGWHVDRRQYPQKMWQATLGGQHCSRELKGSGICVISVAVFRAEYCTLSSQSQVTV